MEKTTTPSEGVIWDKAGKLVVKLREETFDVPKNEKKGDKQPDWKNERVAVWNKISAKGNEYRFIQVDKVNYVAFRQKDKSGDNPPDWIIKKSMPIKRDD